MPKTDQRTLHLVQENLRRQQEERRRQSKERKTAPASVAASSTPSQITLHQKSVEPAGPDSSSVSGTRPCLLEEHVPKDVSPEVCEIQQPVSLASSASPPSQDSSVSLSFQASQSPLPLSGVFPKIEEKIPDSGMSGGEPKGEVKQSEATIVEVVKSEAVPLAIIRETVLDLPPTSEPKPSKKTLAIIDFGDEEMPASPLPSPTLLRSTALVAEPAVAPDLVFDDSFVTCDPFPSERHSKIPEKNVSKSMFGLRVDSRPRGFGCNDRALQKTPLPPHATRYLDRVLLEVEGSDVVQKVAERIGVLPRDLEVMALLPYCNFDLDLALIPHRSAIGQNSIAELVVHLSGCDADRILEASYIIYVLRKIEGERKAEEKRNAEKKSTKAGGACQDGGSRPVPKKDSEFTASIPVSEAEVQGMVERLFSLADRMDPRSAYALRFYGESRRLAHELASWCDQQNPRLFTKANI